MKMKGLLISNILILLLAFTTCKPKHVVVPEPIYQTDTLIVRKTDTIYLKDTVYLESQVCLENRLMVMNIRHYVKITEQNSKNREFFYGWIKRAVQE